MFQGRADHGSLTNSARPNATRAMHYRNALDAHNTGRASRFRDHRCIRARGFFSASTPRASQNFRKKEEGMLCFRVDITSSMRVASGSLCPSETWS